MYKVSLIAHTQPLNDTAENFIAYCARVSNPTNQYNKGTGPKLLRYCAKNGHWSVFEMVNAVMDIHCTRDIGRQILRHNSFRFQEFSQRYANPTDMGFAMRDARLQDTKNRQNSIENENQELQSEWIRRQQQHVEMAKNDYAWAIEQGIAKEQARAILPEGLTMSRMFVSGTLRSWIHYCNLRRGNGTQKEHMEIAEACWTELCKVFPILKEICE